ARLRGIRTIAEFDTPSHIRSWGLSHPELLSACDGVHKGSIDPTNNNTYEFMQNLLREVGTVFPDEYIHLGGDEVDFECWDWNDQIDDYMDRHRMTSFEELEGHYIHRLMNTLNESGHKSMVWQEVFENGIQLPPETIVQVWTGDWAQLLDNITESGLFGILSSCWYLDDLETGGDWEKFYEYEPSDFPGNDEQQSRLIGGEACMWTEVVDDTNIVSRIFPRVSAVAEKLWSQNCASDEDEARHRLEEHTCRMKKRGLQAQPPNGPGFCV
ncbi:beta-hexosaminidase subunit alpha-like, partial [Sitodiplosis mosellana]|uniref:beta-hexosaminidase subunit alpha-like n=1 Tax=Sitodiplosis mosellana TaxID=263140 RepID=UPI002443E4F4